MLSVALFCFVGALLVSVAFQVSGALGIALAIVGVVLLWCAFLAVLKRFGRLG